MECHGNPLELVLRAAAKNTCPFLVHTLLFSLRSRFLEV